jgi:general secretion pathway protein C
MKRLSLILSVVLFVALCASTAYWVMQFMKPAARKVIAPPAMKPIADVESVAGLFGGAMAVNTSYQLKGIVLANPADQSGAIIAADGKQTQAYRINAEINPGVTLSEVHADYVLILDNGVSKRLDLPQELKSSQIAEVANTSPVRAAPPPTSAPGNRRENDSDFLGRSVHVRGFKPIPAGNGKRQPGAAANGNAPADPPANDQ